MEKEFLHTIVKEREEKQRVYDSRVSFDQGSRLADMVRRDMERLYSRSLGDSTSGTGEMFTSIEQSRFDDDTRVIVASTASNMPTETTYNLESTRIIDMLSEVAMTQPRTEAVNGVYLGLEFNINGSRLRHYRRTNVRIGMLPDVARTMTLALGRVASVLLTQHSCFPDYNARSLRSIGTEFVALDVECARCSSTITVRTNNG